MRIITGTAKGRKIKAPEGLNTRPTSDRVKESLFNILNNKVNINGAKVLDLFAGTGNLGLEALSRGALNCIFVEHDKKTYNILNENIKTLGFNDIAKVYNQDSFAFLDFLNKLKQKFDIIFLDPPYGKGFIEKAIALIISYDLIEKGGIIIGEYDEGDEMPYNIRDFEIIRTEKYGRTKISFWTKEE